MKFYTFDELTYPGLKDIGPEVRFTNRFCDPLVASANYQDHLDEWVMCEDLGFDGAFVNEHHFTAMNTQPACNIMAAAIISRTKRMKVGVIGNVIPLRHPIRTAEEFAMLDVLSGGRFIGGIVRGVPQEYVSYNIDSFTSRERLRESFDIIYKALTEELFDYEGKFWNVTAVSIWPRPIQQPLPICMPTGSLETIEFAAERRIMGAQVFFTPEMYRDCFNLYRQIAETKHGWTPGYGQFIGARLIHVAETDAQANEEAERAIRYMFGSASASRPVNNPAPVPGLATDKSYSFRTTADRETFPAPNVPFEELREKGWIVSGSPETVTEWLRYDMTTSGYGHFLGMFHVGNLPHEKVVKSKQLFAKHIMPKLAGLNVDPPDMLTAVPRLPERQAVPAEQFNR